MFLHPFQPLRLSSGIPGGPNYGQFHPHGSATAAPESTGHDRGRGKRQPVHHIIADRASSDSQVAGAQTGQHQEEGRDQEEEEEEEKKERQQQGELGTAGRWLRLGRRIRGVFRAVLGRRTGQVLRGALRRGHGDLHRLLGLGRILDTCDTVLPVLGPR